MIKRTGESMQKSIYTDKQFAHKKNAYDDKLILPLGIQNIGNTCFLNSIIQFLYAS
jgi:ubiquitin C-terminal hydrolase